MTRVTCAVVLVFLLSMAGCSGIIGEVTPTSTLTPAEVPTDSPSPTAARELAPGLTQEGVTDAWALAGAHEDELANTSHTVTDVERRWTLDGNSIGHITTVSLVEPVRERVHWVRESTGEPKHGIVHALKVAFYREGEQAYLAITQDGDTSYHVYGDPAGGRSMRIFLLLSAVDARLVGTTTDHGVVRYRVRSTRIRHPDQFAAAVGVSQNVLQNGSIRAVLDEQGLIHEYEYTYVVEREDSHRRVSRQVRYTALGETIVTRPAWYDDAVNASGTIAEN